jgi:hypothetical protein
MKPAGTTKLRRRDRGLRTATGNGPKVPDSSAVVNTDRELLESRSGVSLYKVAEDPRQVYVVERGSSFWRYDLLFPAQSKFARLIAKQNGRTP